MRAKHVILLAPLVAAVLSAGASPAAAQSWPTRPVTMVVPFAAGGGTDVLGRIVGRRLSELLGQQVIIENVGGAGGMVGSARVVKAPPDGYQFVLGSRADAINQTLYKNPLYNFATDLAPVVLIADQPTLLVARKDFPAADLQEFIAYAKANQSSLQYGLGRRRLHRPSRLHAAQRRGRHQRRPHSLSRRRAGDAGPDRRPHRLHLHAQRHRQAADREQPDQADRDPHARALADAAGAGRARTSRASPISRPPPGSASSCRRARRRRSSRSCTTPRSPPMDTPSVQERLKEVGAIVVAPERRSPEYLQAFVESEIAKNAIPIKATGVAID